MWKHRALILNHYTFEELTENIVVDENNGINDYIDFKHEPYNDPTENNSTASRLAKNYTYSKDEFKVIGIRAFLSTHIREILSV